MAPAPIAADPADQMNERDLEMWAGLIDERKQAGVHGRQNGHWNKAMGERTKLRCIQCHDPHYPLFQPMKALPPL